jgi:hypothetical protein
MLVRRMLLSTIVALALSLGAHAQVLAGWSVVETDHFRVHFPPKPQADPASFPKGLEQAYAQLQPRFGGTLPGKINFYVWNSSAEGEALLGRPLGFADPARLLVHATADQTRGHELTHVLVHHGVHPEVTSRFISEGTAVAFDLSERDHLRTARSVLRGKAPTVAQLWTGEMRTPDALLYPLAGAFVERLYRLGGRERFLRLLKVQTLDHGREVYGPDLSKMIADFESDLGSVEQTPPVIEELRAKAQARMRQDQQTFTAEQFREIESSYQAAGRDLRSPENRARAMELVNKYPKANRSGCLLLYIAQASIGDERETLLKRAIADHFDDWYGDGSQVGPFAKAQLALHYARSNRQAEAAALANEVAKLSPEAVDHAGARLVDMLKKLEVLR